MKAIGRRTVLVACWAASAIAASQASSEGEVSPRDELFRIMKQRAMANTKEVFAAEERRVRSKQLLESETRTFGARRTQALEPENAATTADRLAVALKTDIAGTEAGVTAAPFGLAENPSLRGFNLTLGALKNDMVRVGASYSHDFSKPLLGPEDIGLKSCELDEARLGEELELVGQSLDAVCRNVIWLVPEPPEKNDKGKIDRRPRDRWRTARIACGLEKGSTGYPGPAEGLTLTEAIASIKSAIRIAKDKNTDVDRAVTAGASDMKRIEQFDLPTGTSCHADKEIAAAFQRARWKSTRVRLGTSVTGEFFPRKSGFNPDPSKPLPKGEASKWQARAEVSVGRRRLDFAAGVGAGQVREDLASPLRGFLSPSASLAFAAFNLSPDPLVDKGTLNLPDGKVPPHVVLGLDAKGEIALSRPDSQTTRFNKVEVLPFVDFKITEKLSFRLGAPIRAEIAIRKADDKKGIAEQRGLQWTVPFSVVTVIKL